MIVNIIQKKFLVFDIAIKEKHVAIAELSRLKNERTEKLIEQGTIKGSLRIEIKSRQCRNKRNSRKSRYKKYRKHRGISLQSYF